MKTIGRNELCPCGSGKKYKHCCLGQAEPATTETGRLAHVRNATERAVFERIMAWTDHKLGRAWLRGTIETMVELEPIEEDELQFLMPWLVYHMPADRKRRRTILGVGPASLAARFLAEEGEHLSAAERVTLTANVRANISVWEARRVEPGVGVELFDLLTHEVRFVHEVRGTRMMARWHILLASVVDYPEVSVFGGLYPRVLMPGQAERVLSAVRRTFAIGKRVLEPANLRGEHIQIALVLTWRQALREADRATLEPRILSNTDGDPILFCTDRFDILGSTDELLHALEAIDGAEIQHTDHIEEVVFTRAGKSLQNRFGNTIVGRAVVNGNQLWVETNSESRAKTLRKKIERAARSRLRYRLGQRCDVNDVLEDPPPVARVPGPAASVEQREGMQHTLERMRDAWVDDRVPALSGRTPRQAAMSPTLRPRLVALLKGFELNEAARPADERYDVGRLWRALGIDPLAPEASRPARTASRGGSRSSRGGNRDESRP